MKKNKSCKNREEVNEWEKLAQMIKGKNGIKETNIP